MENKSLIPAGQETAPDFSVDEKSHQVTVSEAGFEHSEQLLTDAGLLKIGSSLYDPANITLIHHLNAGLRAHYLYFLDQSATKSSLI
jgi:preprotein translocase subunit SecA